MTKSEIEKEKDWWEQHISIEYELKKPYSGRWDLYHWKKMFDKIIQNYDFDNKRIFVGGCGTGIFEEWISKSHKPKRIVGMDLTPKMIQIANIRKKNAGFDAEFMIGNIEETNLDDNSFDDNMVPNGF